MAVYYNEIDEYAAEWLRNLIKANAIAPGDVDTRSIADVAVEDLKGYTQHHFFAGIGGWSLALRLAGWPDDRPVWTGSCPCQPFSSAGKRKGAGDDRHLWPEWFRLIRQYRPAIIFGEQVAAAIAHGWLDEVAYGLETENYAFGAAILPACAADAFHRRDRLWFVANALDGQFSEARRGSQRGAGQRDDDKAIAGAMAYASGDGARRGVGDVPGAHGRPDGELHERIDGAGSIIMEDTKGIGRGKGQRESTGQPGRHDAAIRSGSGVSPMGDTQHLRSHATAQPGSDGEAVCDHQGGQDGAGESSGAGRSFDVADTPGAGSHAPAYAGIHSGEESPGARHEQPQRCGSDVGNADQPGCEELEGLGADAGQAGQPQPSDTNSGILWLQCPDGKARPVKSGLRLLVDGLSADMGADRPGEDSPYRTIIDPETGKPIGQAPWRIGMIKGFGNSIDTRVAAQFIDGAWEAIAA